MGRLQEREIVAMVKDFHMALKELAGHTTIHYELAGKDVGSSLALRRRAPVEVMEDHAVAGQ
ncbi:hypothetical protein [Streptomyces wuyuanensis]|uniref:hypothetical protein n=1 Tax=Streptomyces wuyuanensis TaxID=1196353 RepID=UPI0036901949